MKKTFRTSTYEIHTDKLKNGHKVRFAFLTDLHGLIYGNNHQELYDAVLKHDPAAVLVAGDMIVNRKTETLQAAAVLLSRLSENSFFAKNKTFLPKPLAIHGALC